MTDNKYDRKTLNNMIKQKLDEIEQLLELLYGPMDLDNNKEVCSVYNRIANDINKLFAGDEDIG